jgi:hypothetical protein
MKKKGNKTKLSVEHADKDGKEDLPGYPSYPDNEDIYSKDKEEKNIDPEL